MAYVCHEPHDFKFAPGNIAVHVFNEILRGCCEEGTESRSRLPEGKELKMTKQTYDGPIKAAGAPYTPAVGANGFVFISGQVPLDPATKQIVPGGIEEQARRALANLCDVLEAAGLTPECVVKTTIYLANMADYAAVNAIYAETFASEPPARTAVAVAALPFGSLIEIDAIAAR